jgi:hypothetical protein
MDYLMIDSGGRYARKGSFGWGRPVAIRVSDPFQVRFGLVPRSERPTLGHAWPGAAHINIGSGSHLYSRHHILSLTEYTHLMPLNNLNYLSNLNYNTASAPRFIM